MAEDKLSKPLEAPGTRVSLVIPVFDEAPALEELSRGPRNGKYMCELKGSLAAHKKRGHLTLSVGLVIFALLTTACGRLTPRSATEATPQPADGTLATRHEMTPSTQVQPGLPQDPKFTHITR